MTLHQPFQEQFLPLAPLPEQAKTEEVDARTDIYALGVLLYEILTLKRPFEGRQMHVMAAVLRDDPTPPRVRAPGRVIPLELEEACLTALSKDPEDRFSRACLS